MVTINLHLYKYLTLAALSILILSGCLEKPHPPKGDFNGEIIDSLTREPVSGAAIVMGGNLTTTANDGKFSFAVLSPGDYQMTVTRDWYHQGIFHITHVGKKDLWTFELESEPLVPGRILYSGYTESQYDIYELDLTSRKVTRLSNTMWSETNPVKLPDGRIIFQSNRNGQNNDLYIANSGDVDTAERIPCSSMDCDDEYPSVTTNSNEIKLVFKSGEKDSKGNTIRFICLYNLTEKQSQSVIIMDADNKKITGFHPVINPDGSKIALVSGDYKRLIIFNVSGMSVTKSREFDFYSAANLKINNPCWSPMGDYIAFEAYNNSDGPRAIYRISANESLESALQPVTFIQGSEQHKHPCWSKDGTMIFFSGSIIYSSRDDIYGVKTNAGVNVPWIMVSSGTGNKEYPSWSD